MLLSPYLAYNAPTARQGSGGWATPKVPRTIALSILAGLGLDWWQDSIVIEFNMPESVRDGTETLAYSFRMNTGLHSTDYKADLAAVKVPLLVLIGTDDEAFIADAFEETVREFAPFAETRLVRGASHMGIVVGPQSPTEIVSWLREI